MSKEVWHRYEITMALEVSTLTDVDAVTDVTDDDKRDLLAEKAAELLTAMSAERYGAGCCVTSYRLVGKEDA